MKKFSREFLLRIFGAITFMLIFATGCSTSPAHQLQTISSNDVNSDVQDYLIQPGDQMDVKFFNAPEFNESITVRPDGRVSLELAHEVRAAGRTTEELSAVLVERYRTELNAPKVTVIVKNFAGQKVFVQGEVNKPDLVALSPNMTLFQSIAVAGGLKDTARTDQIILIRRGRDGERKIAKIDLTELLEGSGAKSDFRLAPYDIVYVPKSGVAELNVWVDKYLRQNLPISFSLAYGVNQ